MKRFLKKNSYTICSTSNLLEKNNCWQIISKEANLKFSNYGDITSNLISEDQTSSIIIIFLEDLIQSNSEDYSSLEKSNELFFNLLEEKLKKSEKPMILCFASRGEASAIKLSRSDTQLRRFHLRLIKKFINLRDKFEIFYFVNLDQVFYEAGSAAVFSDRNWYFSRCRLSIKGLNILTKSIVSVIQRIMIPPKKVLILDCDNTLWGGVIGEDGLKGLVLGQDGLGQAFSDFQKQCFSLSQEGVLLALASKNNEEDVWRVFNNHPGMVLKRENIITSEINWDEKSTNLEKISKNLDLGIESFVFWDDNPIERDKMRAVMPNVLTIEVPENVIEWPYLLRNLDCFAKLRVTSNDQYKLQQYKLRAEFISEAKKATDINSYLAMINLIPKRISICDANISRAEQMSQKTNQFNLRAKRYSASELMYQNKNPNTELFMVNLLDNFGDHGLVALIGLHYEKGNIVFIDTFLMSCRILGRHLEAWILNEIITLAKVKKCKYLFIDFIESDKNKIAKNFLDSYGFKSLEDDSLALPFLRKNKKKDFEGTIYSLYVEDKKIPNLEIFKVSHS